MTPLRFKRIEPSAIPSICESTSRKFPDSKFWVDQQNTLWIIPPDEDARQTILDWVVSALTDVYRKQYAQVG